MKILAFDTAFAAVSAAVSVGGATVAWRRVDTPRGHAELLLPMIAAVLGEAGLAARDLDRVATDRGPGHFTGLRAGIAAAQGLALAGGVGLWGFTSFAVLAAGLDPPAAGERRVIAFDSKRAEAFVRIDDETPVACLPADLAPAGDRFVVAGDRAPEFAAALQARGRIARVAEGPTLPDARLLLRLAQAATGTPQAPVPLYIHPPATTAPKHP